MLLLLLLIGGGSYAWGETKTGTWDLTKNSKEWTASGNVEYFSQPYGFKKAGGTLTNKSIADFSIDGISQIKVGFKCLQNRSNDSQLTIWLVDKDGKTLGDGVVVTPVNKQNANQTSFQYATFTTNLEAATGFMMKVTKFGKNILVNGAQYEVEYSAAPAANLTSIAVSGTPTKTTYEEGEKFDPTGLVVTGTYDDGTEKAITDGIAWEADPLKLGTTSVDVKASVGNITSNIYTVTGITVKEKVTLIGIKANGTLVKFWKGDKFNHDGITITARWSDESETNVTELCQFTEPDMTTAGKKTVTVTYENKTCTYDIEVKTIENTKETAYTVSEAKKLIDAGKDLATQVYVKGVVSKIDSYNAQYESITYWLDDNTFQVYSGKGLNGEVFTSKEDIAVGANVIICGKIKKFNKTYEFDKENYLVEYNAPVEKVLKSIAISGEATKTTYFEGETFDPTGLVVTATYEDESTEDVTGRVKWTFNPETLAVGTTSVDVTANYQNVESASFKVDVAVSSFDAVDCEAVDFTEVFSHVTGKDNEEVKSYQGTSFSMEFAKPQSSRTPTKYYANGTAVRAYEGNTITITAVQDIKYVLINYVKSYEDNGVEIKGLGTKTVVVTTSEASRFTSITVYYKGVDFRAKSGENYYATFSCDRDVEFLEAEVFTVNVENGTISLNEIASKQVPANTGVLLRNAKESDVFTYIESAPAIEGTNLLKPASEKMTEGFKFYKLAYDNYTEKTGLGFYWGAAEGGAFTVKPGLAYLAVPQAQAANVKGFSFDGTQTGINGVEATTAKGAIYNLNGQRVEKAQRGIYIQNGKKFIVK